MKMKARGKKYISLILTGIMSLSICLPAYASSEEPDKVALETVSEEAVSEDEIGRAHV